MTDAARHDVWAQGAGYERYIGRWSRPVTVAFLDWLAIPPGKAWLDVGCGTGALSQRILDTAAPASVVGVDSSEGFVAHAKAHVADKRADFRVGDAQALPVADGEFDAVLSGLVLNFVPDQAKAVSEMRRATRPGGFVAVYVWDYAGEMQLMRRFWDAAAALDPAARALDEGLRFPLCRPDPLHALFTGAGLRDVETQRDRRADTIRGFRRLLVALPRRPGPGAGLLHEAAGGRPRGLARTPTIVAAHGARRKNPADRPRLGGAGGGVKLRNLVETGQRPRGLPCQNPLHPRPAFANRMQIRLSNRCPARQRAHAQRLIRRRARIAGPIMPPVLVPVLGREENKRMRLVRARHRDRHQHGPAARSAAAAGDAALT